MTSYERGDIVLVPFPFSDQSTTKRRPAVIVSSDAYNSISQDCVIMAITSRIDKAFGVAGCLIEDWDGAGLLKPSSIKPAVSTIERSLILRKLGRLSSNDLHIMDKVLKELLELS